MEGDREKVISEHEDRLIEAIRRQIDCRACPEDVADRLARVIQADAGSSVGAWLTKQGLFETGGA